MKDSKKFSITADKKPPSKSTNINESLFAGAEKEKKPLSSLLGGDNKVTQGLFGNKPADEKKP